MMRDIRSKYEDKVRLEFGGHQDTVKAIVFGELDNDVLCLTAGADCKLKLWDLRQRRCIRDYGGDSDALASGGFHTNSIWQICPTSSSEACFTGGKDGAIFHSDLVGGQHTKLYQASKSPVNSLCFDEANLKLWFSTTTDSSLKCLDLATRQLEEAAANQTGAKQADYELAGLAWMTDYHVLKNKRYVLTNNS